MDDFFKFIIERYSIFLNKEIFKIKQPYTHDIILQKYKFCNIFREDDAGTKLIMDLPDDNPQELLLNLFIYRIFNRRNHFENIKWVSINSFNEVKFKKNLIELRKVAPIFAIAYVGNWNLDNIISGIKYIINNNPNYLIYDNPVSVYENLQKIKSVGPFLAYQLFLDLSYYPNLFHKFNGNDFVVIGPGSIGGIELILNEQKSNLTKNQCIDFIYNIRDNIQYTYLSNTNVPLLTLSAIEHSLCEYRKYIYLKKGIGIGKKRLFK